MRFDHGVEHLRGGNSDRGANLLRHGYEQARDLSRKYEDLLGDTFYQAVLNYTDLGAGILRSSLVVTNETLVKLEQEGFEASKLHGLRKVVGKPISVTEVKPRLRDVDIRVGLNPRRSVTLFFNITGGFDVDAYREAKD